MSERYKPKKLTPIDGLVVVSVCLFLLAVPIAVTASSQPTFRDGSKNLGLELGNSAVACIDYNNDGWADLYSAGELWNNICGKSFSKIMKKGDKAVWADFDNDGYLDFYDYNNQKLFWNDHNKAFVPQSFPELSMKSSQGASWADHNGDGYVDLYIGGYETGDINDTNIGLSHPDARVTNLADPRKKGCRRFEIVWEQQEDQLRNVQGRARGITSCDFDEDGDVDIYASNYRRQPNLLWLNDGKGKFENVADEYEVAGHPDTAESVAEWLMSHGKVEDAWRLKSWAATRPKAIIKGIPGFTIGSAWADLDNDGHLDLFVGNLSHRSPPEDPPMFYRNMGPSKSYHFQDKSATAGLARRESYASPALGDYDNDGDLDLFLTAVGGKDYPCQYSVLYRNEGNWTFRDVTDCVGLYDAMPTDPLDGYQAAWADFDNDGDLDLVTDGKLFVNQGNINNWLKVHLQGDGKQVNRSAIGAQVRIKLKDRTLTRQVEAGTGKGNQNDLTLHFGLGTHNKPVNLEIFWPNGTCQTVEQVCPNQTKPVHFSETK